MHEAGRIKSVRKLITNQRCKISNLSEGDTYIVDNEIEALVSFRV